MPQNTMVETRTMPTDLEIARAATRLAREKIGGGSQPPHFGQPHGNLPGCLIPHILIPGDSRQKLHRQAQLLR